MRARQIPKLYKNQATDTNESAKSLSIELPIAHSDQKYQAESLVLREKPYSAGVYQSPTTTQQVDSFSQASFSSHCF